MKTALPVADVRLRGYTPGVTVKRTVNAPPATVWDVMTDHPAYADEASNFAKV